MAATDASEVLAQFAVGRGDADVCTPDGRALLRGAVRAYGGAMQAAGVNWPALEPADRNASVGAIEASVLVAFAAGFVEASDFRGARAMAAQLSFMHWPELRDLRAAARVACGDVVALQQAAARVVIETERLREMSESAQRRDRMSRNGGQRLMGQHRLVERAHTAMQQRAAVVEARMREARAS